MAKKRKSNKPNIPQETLERVRRKANADDLSASADDDADTDEDDDLAEDLADDSKQTAAERRAERAARRAERRARASSGRGALKASATGVKRERRSDSATDHDAIRERLAHPTKSITEADLRGEYMYVLNDLKSMFVLSAVLVVVIILLGSFI